MKIKDKKIELLLTSFQATDNCNPGINCEQCPIYSLNHEIGLICNKEKKQS